MATRDDGYGKENARDGTFTLAETAVVLYAIGASTKWERTFFDLVAESDPTTRSEIALIFPHLVKAWHDFVEGDLRERWADSHSELAAALRTSRGSGLA